MADRRIVIEHEDGRRLSISEADFDRPEANPYNHGAQIQSVDLDAGTSTTTHRAAKPLDDHQSLKREGFKPVMAIHPETGHEIPLKGAS